MEKYTKTIEFNFDVNEKSKKKVDALLSSLEELKTINVEGLDKDNIGSIKDLITSLKDTQNLGIKRPNAKASLKSLTNKINSSEYQSMLSVLTDFKASVDRFMSRNFQALVDIGKNLKQTLIPTFSDIKFAADEILKYSKLSNAVVRDTALSFGFNAAESYAYRQTMDLLGLRNFEDLYWLNSQESAKFKEKFTEYQGRYAGLNDSGMLSSYQDLQWQVEEFKEDLSYLALQFIVDNKDIVIEAFDWINDALQFVIDHKDEILDTMDSIMTGIKNTVTTISDSLGVISTAITDVKTTISNAKDFWRRYKEISNQVSVYSNDIYNVGSPTEALAIGQNKYSFLQTSAGFGG